eukprot:7607228-Pyramimonas_sp.AAC.1
MGSEDRAASPMHRRRRRCIGDFSAENIGLHIEPNRPYIGDAACSFDLAIARTCIPHAFVGLVRACLAR